MSAGQPTAPDAAALIPPIRSTDKTILANKGFLCKHTVGSGSYSKVKVAMRIRSSSATEKYAFKIIDRSKAPKDFQQKFLPRELEIWPQLKHPNIIRMYSYFEHEPKIYMLLEYAEGGDVLDHVQKSGALSQRQARTWIKQILDAVCYLHRLGIAHRDLKLENLLIDDQFNVKICDFGFAKLDIVNPSSTFCGSKAYAAPEILAGQEYSPTKADVWAIGVILYIFVTGTMPFNEEFKNRIILKAQQDLTFPWKNFSGVSQDCRNLILSMFTYDFVERPEIQAVVRAPWFAIEKPVRPKFPVRPKSRSGDGRGGDADSVRPSLSVESGVQTSPRMPPRQSFAGYYSQKPRMKQSAGDSNYARQQQQSRSVVENACSRGTPTVNGGPYQCNANSVSGSHSRPSAEDRRASSGHCNGNARPGSNVGGGGNSSQRVTSGGGGSSTQRVTSGGGGSSTQRVTRAMSSGKSPSPLAEPPRPKRIWLNGGVPEQSVNDVDRNHWHNSHEVSSGCYSASSKQGGVQYRR